eukprot:18923-Pelagococcus_subviridis.AAC.3
MNVVLNLSVWFGGESDDESPRGFPLPRARQPEHDTARLHTKERASDRTTSECERQRSRSRSSLDVKRRDFQRPLPVLHRRMIVVVRLRGDNLHARDLAPSLRRTLPNDLEPVVQTHLRGVIRRDQDAARRHAQRRRFRERLVVVLDVHGAVASLRQRRRPPLVPATATSATEIALASSPGRRQTRELPRRGVKVLAQRLRRGRDVVERRVARAVSQVSLAVVGVEDARRARGRGCDADAARVGERVQHGYRFRRRRGVLGIRVSFRDDLRHFIPDPPPRRAEVQEQRRVAEPSRRDEVVPQTELGERERGGVVILVVVILLLLLLLLLASSPRAVVARRELAPPVQRVPPSARDRVVSRPPRVVRTPRERALRPRLVPQTRERFAAVVAQSTRARRLRDVSELRLRDRLAPRLHVQRVAVSIDRHPRRALADAVHETERVRALASASREDAARGAARDRVDRDFREGRGGGGARRRRRRAA